MAARPRIAIVGPGRLGTTLALELSQAGYPIAEVISREAEGSRKKACLLARRLRARASTVRTPHLDANLIWFCVPDSQITSAARTLARSTDWKEKIAFHSSGALASDELYPLRRRGAAVAAVHPMMTFVSNSKPSLAGVPFALEGDRPAVRLARQIVYSLRASSFTIRKRDKAIYHAWGAFTSPLLVAAFITMEKVAQAAGLAPADARRKMLPIVKQTMRNYDRLGPAGAFSGPLIRGDVGTVRQHLRTLKRVRGAADIYVALARAALLYLPVAQRQKLQRILKP